MCASLCDAVTGEKMAGVAGNPERSNLFVVPLDDRRHGIAIIISSQTSCNPICVKYNLVQDSILHQRASTWYEQNDLAPDAIHHALAAMDFPRAADLIEKIWLIMELNYQHDTWLGWVKSLPDELVRSHPVICVGYAWALLGTGELEASEARLRDAERWLGSTDTHAGDSPIDLPPEHGPGMVVVDEAEFRALPASIAAARAYRALAMGDLSGTKMHARQALTLAPDDTSPHHTQAIALLGIAEYASGDLHAAEQELLKFQALMWQVNDIASAIGITFSLADIKLIQGRLREAVSAYQQSLQLADKHDAPSFIGASDLHRGLSELLCEQNDLGAAEQYLLTAQQLGEQGATTGWHQRLFAAQARLKKSLGDLYGALELLEEAERESVKNPLPGRPVAALKARTWLRLGQLTEALSWVSEQNLLPDDKLSFRREFEHLTLARTLIARYKTGLLEDDLHAALGLLNRLTQAAQAGERNGSVIEILILQAQAHQTAGDQAPALAALERAMTLAEPEGYIRIFVDEGEPMRLLIEELSQNRNHPLNGYAVKLLAAFTLPAAAPKSAVSHRKSGMVEPLSERELEVLKLLRSELSGPEIAQRLVVSLNTLRTHTKNIFNKLGVNNRRAAVRRAEELDLF